MKRFPNGSRVCFVGDSLVCKNLTLSWVVDCYRNNFPNEDIRFFNCGTAGGTAKFALRVFEDDVLRFKPTHAVVAFGINDSCRERLMDERGTERYNILKQSFETYKQSIKKLCEKILENNIELILCTPAPYDEYEPTEQEALKGGYVLMSEYANFIRCFATQYNYTLCDYYEKMVEIMQIEKLYGSDHVHPMAHGYYRMAEIFLNKQGLKIGDECDIAQKYPKWNEAVGLYRRIYIAECLILKKVELPIKEKLRIARDFVAENENKAKDWLSKWFVELCESYLESREKVQELSEQLEQIYEKEVLRIHTKN